MDRVSVPLWGATLSGPLPVVVLVGRYPHQLTDGPQAPPKVAFAFTYSFLNPVSLFGFATRFQVIFPSLGQVTNVLLTRSPLMYCYTRSTCMY